MTRSFGPLVLCFLFISALAAQPGAPLQFEVAAIKLSPPLNGGFIRVGSSLNGSTMHYERMSLRQLIVAAYEVKDDQVSGPDWLDRDKWDIEAKLPDGAKRKDVPAMLQALLTDRFGLKFHHETRQHSVWSLVAPKGAEKLTPGDPPPPLSDAEQEKRLANMPPQVAEMMRKAQAAARAEAERENGGKDAPPAKRKGSVNTTTSPSGGLLGGQGVTLQEVADALSPYAGRPVINETDIPGTFNIQISLSADEVMNSRNSMMRELMASMPPRPNPNASSSAGDTAGAPPPPPRPGRGRGGVDITGESLFQSVQRSGLKLESKKAPLDLIVIDHVEKAPTEN